MTKKLCAVILLAITSMLILTSCGNKTARGARSFTDFMEGKGFEVTDVTSDIGDDESFRTAVVAENENYVIEYYILADAATAEDMFYANQVMFNDLYPTKLMSKETSGSNYNYYHFTGGEDFCLASRVDDTMIFCIADKSFKDEILNVVKELGY